MSVSPRIESYIYNPAGTGLSDLSSVFEIAEGATTQLAQTNATVTITEALVQWWTVANAAAVLANTYYYSYNDTTNRFTFSSSGTFSITFRGNQAALFGFTAATLTGATSYTGDAAPRGMYAPLALDYNVPTAVEDTKLLEFRGGRAIAQAWPQAAALDIRIKDTTENIEAQLVGPCLRGGRVLIAPTTDRAAEYSYANQDGFFTADVYAIGKIRTYGQAEQLAELTLTCHTAQALG